MVKMLPTKEILVVLAFLMAAESLVEGRVHGGGGGGGGSEIRKKHRTEHLHHLQE